MSRQREYQLRQHAQGLCAACPTEVPGGGWYCPEHALANRTRQRKRRGGRPWEPGKPGRPPADVAMRPR